MVKKGKKKTSAPPADAGARSSSAGSSVPVQHAVESTPQSGGGGDAPVQQKGGRKGKGRGKDSGPPREDLSASMKGLSFGESSQAVSHPAASTEPSAPVRGPPPGSGRGQSSGAPPPGFGRGQRGSQDARPSGGQSAPSQPSSTASRAWTPKSQDPVFKSPPQGTEAPPSQPQTKYQGQIGATIEQAPQTRGAQPPVQPSPSRGMPPAREGRGAGAATSQAPFQVQVGVATVRAPQQGRGPPAVQPPPRGNGDISHGKLCLTIPQRRDINKAGTLGKPIIVETNHLALNLSKLREALHYDVTLVPDVPKRLLRFAMEELRRKCYPNRYPAFDGRKNLISASLLPFGENLMETVNVRDEESQREKEFKITIKLVATIDLSSLRSYTRAGTSLETPQTAIQMIDIVLRSAAALRFVPVGRSFFTPPTGRIVSLGDGLEMWLGLFQSVNLGWKPFVNVDVVHKGFPKQQPVVDAIGEILNRDPRGPLNEYDKEEFNKYIRGLKVDYMIPGQPNTKRTYRVNKLVKPASQLRFDLNGKSVTVEQYFHTEKRTPLKYSNLPCLHVGSLQRPNPIYLPAEFCTITGGQAINRKMNETQTSAMIKQAATNTMDRKRKIRDALRTVNFNQDPAVQEFGLSVSENFEKVPARILDPPSLTFQREQREIMVTPRKGVWPFTSFLTGKSLTKWAVLNLDNRLPNDDINYLADMLKNVGRSLGMNIEYPEGPFTSMKAPNINQDCFKLEEYFSYNKDKELVLVVVPDRGNAYAKVKQVAELTVGVLTQCIKARTVKRMNNATASNLLLKINSKLNGVNHKLSASVRPKCLEHPAMLVGADVTHPSPDQINIPSVAAVCASHDPNGFCYNIQIRLQPARQEIITDLEAIIRSHLIYFFKKTGQKPNRILFYRDGVSEGQFSQVLSAELLAIRGACTKIQKDGSYNPSITFLVVQKRHHTRFFPTRPEDEDGRNANVPAGTIVDTIITHPTELDFYLVSHASIQGVSRPTKYRCLWDDSNMTEDQLEQLTYFLCHMFSRCTRSVSYPAPTYYAHLAAYRARVHIEGREVQMNNLQHEQELSKICETLKLGSPMFFV